MTIDYKVFQFLRGAFRGLYGKEDFTDKRIIIRGLSEGGEGLIKRLRYTGAKLLFSPTSMSDYCRAFSICPEIEEAPNEHPMFVDVVVDFVNQVFDLVEMPYYMNEIGEDPYNQGIHEFYF